MTTPTRRRKQPTKAEKAKAAKLQTRSRMYVEIPANGTHGPLVLFVSVHEPGKRGGAGPETSVDTRQLGILLSNASSKVTLLAESEMNAPTKA